MTCIIIHSVQHVSQLSICYAFSFKKAKHKKETKEKKILNTFNIQYYNFLSTEHEIFLFVSIFFFVISILDSFDEEGKYFNYIGVTMPKKASNCAICDNSNRTSICAVCVNYRCIYRYMYNRR